MIDRWFPLVMSMADGTEHHTTVSDILSRHKYTILYFYPKDDTPGCTIEAKDFTDHFHDFADHQVWVYGVSKDPHRSHCKFITKYGLPFPLIVDTDFSFHEMFGSVGMKSMYGKEYRGTIRSTFLLDQEWGVVKERRNVSAAGHVAEVLEYVKTLS